MLPATSEALLEKLRDVNPYFDKLMREDFERSIRSRTSYSQKCIIPSALAIISDNEKLLLQDLAFASPNFEIVSFKVCLKRLCIDIVLKLNELVVKGQVVKYFSENSTLLQIHGDITFLFKGVTIDVCMPINNEEDSFVMNPTYLFSFNKEKIVLKDPWSETYMIEPIKEKILKSIFPGLIESFSDVLFNDIGGSIVEHSFSELFADEPEEMRVFSDERMDLAKKLSKRILEHANKLQRNNSINLPNMHLKFNMCLVSLKNGILQNLLQMRYHSSCFTEESNEIYLNFALEMRDIILSYNNCTAKTEDVESSGSCKSIFYRTKVIFKVLLEKFEDEYAMKLKDVQFAWTRNMCPEIVGLECAKTCIDDIKLFLAAYFQGELSFALIKHLEEIFRDVITNFHIAQELSI